ncbi:MAG: hypothetical protein BGN92_09815 [Sphingobacteriales bacterium 41-5]|nr:MAG: hypothetical protein BGN92_09815 [Sphingobacteriales bacterium 41-5]
MQTIADLKREYLKAIQAGDSDHAKQLRAAIICAEKFGFATGQELPLFMDYQLTPDGYLCGPYNTDTSDWTLLTASDFQAVQFTKQKMLWQQI